MFGNRVISCLARDNKTLKTLHIRKSNKSIRKFTDNFQKKHSFF